MNKINVVLVQPKKLPKVMMVENDLSEIRRVLGDGVLQYSPVYELGDKFVLIFTKSKSHIIKRLNRYLVDQNGVNYDLIEGDFIVARVDESGRYLESLNNYDIAKINDLYSRPLAFTELPDGGFYGYLIT